VAKEFFYGIMRKRGPDPRSGSASKPPDQRGTPATGRIVKLFVGQGHGVIRSSDAREVFFHRADVEAGTPFNRLNIGDRVAFELFDDPVSGARGLRVRPHKASR
jgi:cold shock CspA family protein